MLKFGKLVPSNQALLGRLSQWADKRQSYTTTSEATHQFSPASREILRGICRHLAKNPDYTQIPSSTLFNASNLRLNGRLMPDKTEKARRKEPLRRVREDTEVKYGTTYTSACPKGAFRLPR